MRIVFFGSSPFGLPSLELLRERHELLAIVTQPDRPAGRGGRLTPTPVALWAESNAPGIPVLKHERVGSPDAMEQIRSFHGDAWVVIAFGQKLPRALLDGMFAINLHASLLPRWRGAAPIHASIVAGDAETGNSVITLADQMDAGEILAVSRRVIEPEQTTGDLHDLLAADGAPLILETLAMREQGSLRYSSQDAAQVTIASKISAADAWVDFSQPADVCRRRINGLSPRPGVGVMHNGNRLKLLRAAPGAREPELRAMEPGAIVDPANGFVACADGVIRLIEVQPAGGRPMPWNAFAAGRSIAAGDVIVGGRAS